jgi:hypothetical protein
MPAPRIQKIAFKTTADLGEIQVGRRRRGIEAFFYRQNHIEYFFRAA